MKKSTSIILLLASLLGTSSAFAGFSWQDEEGKHKTLFYNSRLIARYMYEPIDESSKERREETYKPFYHIFDFDNNKDYITKGPGGKRIFQMQLHGRRRKGTRQHRHLALPPGASGSSGIP